MNIKKIKLSLYQAVEAHRIVRLPHFLDNRLTDGGEDVSLTRRPPFTPKNIPGTHSCHRLSRPQDHSAAGRIRSIEKSSDLILNRNRDLPACSIMPQQTTLLRARNETIDFGKLVCSPQILRTVLYSGCLRDTPKQTRDMSGLRFSQR
jgi:hypothetical protein